MTVYLDLVVILNFLVDFLLLLGTNRLSGFPPGIRKLIPAAALGAGYSGLCMLPGFRFLGSLLWRLVSLVLMAVIAFGWNRSTVKRGCIFVLLSMALGGMAMNVGRPNFPVLILAASGIWLLCTAAFGGSVGGREYVTISLSYGNHTETVVALRDTGNQLRDPVTGEAVLIISGTVAQRLTGLSDRQIQNPMQTIVERPIAGLRLVPYASVGNPCGMLLALPIDNCCMDGSVRRTLVAFAPEELGRGAVYEALTGGTI